VSKTAQRRKDETDLQWRSRLADERVKGEKRDVISPFRLQHDKFAQATVQDGRARNVVQRKVNYILHLASKGRLSDDDAKAVLLYRQAWDICDRSQTRSCIDFSPKGDGNPSLSYLDARKRLAHMQARVRLVCPLPLFEAIACHDKGFTATARDIYGADGARDSVRRKFGKGVELLRSYVGI
jgi:hypothetical protein